MPACSLCGEANPGGALVCRVCGTPQPATQADPARAAGGGGGPAAEPPVVLVHEASGREFVVRPGQTVGRTGKADVVLAGLPGQEYISEVHARIEMRSGRWRIQRLGTTNPLTVDGAELAANGVQAGLLDGAVVGFAGTALRVRYRVPGGGGARA